MTESLFIYLTFVLGKNAVANPSNGKNEHKPNTHSMPLISAKCPNPAAAIPLTPNIRPNIKPAIMPTRPGTASCAYTTIAAKADDNTKPAIIEKTVVQNKFAYGIINANGAIPTNETQITALRPILSPIGPPANVPKATAAKNANKCN